ncbi:ABC transporter ATP-binding protein [Desulfogranum japonicum]|uniref:ABC transporter ATP-binding protein n=1 Tax=Desulfogranum japonicum TaxID=231447 RepID=UPI000405DBE9|nr:ABC transporter ATP-binding protein [Desulfogranum japonicum]
MNHLVYLLRKVHKVRSKGGVTFTLVIPELIVQSGNFVAVVGPSGCGKSTLLDLLAMVSTPTSWDTFTMFAGRDNTRLPMSIPELSDNKRVSLRCANIGYVLQNGGLLPFLNVRENILLTAELNDISNARQKLDYLLTTLGLQDHINKKPQHLSGGQRQRVAVARALIHGPAIILADEPTAAVDYPTALEIRNELKHLAATTGAAVLMVTHDYSLIRDVADMEIHFDLNRISATETISTVSSLSRTGFQTPLLHTENA